ncbi:type II secretion system protein GspM [Pseudoalteromonas rhizosphaerae]|uniref:Type II secretion system protein GspM n=1 Tax=Pseudoalteromonas rhizosphaerae TaxID=2518973 RepID=A0ABW8L6N6_9GAMM
MKTEKSSRSWPIWVKYQARFAALQIREKLAILFAGLFIILYLGYLFIVEPTQIQANKQHQANTQAQQKITQNRTQLAMLEQALSNDYTKELRSQIERAKSELTITDEKLSQFSKGFVSAERVPNMLQQLLKESTEVKVVSFKVLEPKAVDVTKVGANEAKTLFFEHQMVLTLQGQYFNLQQYLASLKQSKEKLLIQRFDYQVEDYPRAQLIIHIATVSANEKFIAL